MNWLCCGPLASEPVLCDLCGNDRRIEKFPLDYRGGKIYLNTISRGSDSHTTDTFFRKSDKYFCKSSKCALKAPNKLMEKTNTFIT